MNVQELGKKRQDYFWENDSAKVMTIVVPVYNRSGLVLRTLDSIQRQTYRPLRLIIVDNNSTDHTPEVLDKWRRANEQADFRVDLLMENSPGASKARQRGFEACRSEYVMFFDSDDTMEPYLVEEVMNTFRKRPNTDLVCWRVRMHGLKGKIRLTNGSFGRPVYSHMVHSLLRTQGYAVRRDYFAKHGGWNRDLTGWDDWELGVRLLLGNPRITALGKIPVDVYCHRDSITGIDFSSKEGEWEKALDHAEKAVQQSEISDKDLYLNWISYKRVILAAQYNREGNILAVRALLKSVLKDQRLSPMRRKFFRFVFHYTTRGGRGSGLPARFIV